jgi:DNA repair protein SbcD/Mre11
VAVTIVHCADVHLETAFTELRGGKRRRAALADAFVRVVDLALERRADALTIGGDLYEAERAGPQTARFLATQFARFGRPVFIAPGNHDPYVAGGLFARQDLPPNVRVYGEAAWLAYPLAGDVTLYGFAHTPAEPGPPFDGARFDGPGVRVALVHGSDAARCPQGKRLTAPFTARDVAHSGATLLLSGHYHGGYVEHTADGRPLFGYPGSLEPIKFGERGTHGALVVTIDGSHVAVEPVEIARTRVLDVTCDLDSTESEYDVLSRVERVLSGLGVDDYVRLRLVGQLQTGTRVDSGLIAERWSSTLGTLDVDDATVAYDYESVAREPTVRGRVVRDLLEQTRACEPASADEAKQALRYALAVFDGEEIAP